MLFELEIVNALLLQVKVLSFDCDTSDATFGPQLYPRLCKLVQAKHNWCRERLLQNLAVRKVGPCVRCKAALGQQLYMLVSPTCVHQQSVGPATFCLPLGGFWPRGSGKNK